MNLIFYTKYGRFAEQAMAFQMSGKRIPWMMRYYNIKRRCELKTDPAYKYYGARGIKCLITPEDLAGIFYRDGGESMKKPSIDRIDNDGNYELANIRFIEMSENSRRAHLGKKRPKRLQKNK